MTLNPLNHKRLSSTSRMQSCLRLLNAAFHHRKYLNGANLASATPAPQRQPPQFACLPESRPPKNRGLPSPHPDWVIAQTLLRGLSAATSNPLCRFFASCLRTVRPELGPSEQVVAVALRNTHPESPATAATTSMRDRLDLSGTEGTSLPS
jgi:hypothetical protein